MNEVELNLYLSKYLTTQTFTLTPYWAFFKEINFSFQASEELEDRQSLAVMAASGQDEVTGPDGETFIEKYTRGVSAVETILTLDRFVFEQNPSSFPSWTSSICLFSDYASQLLSKSWLMQRPNIYFRWEVNPYWALQTIAVLSCAKLSVCLTFHM